MHLTNGAWRQLDLTLNFDSEPEIATMSWSQFEFGRLDFETPTILLQSRSLTPLRYCSHLQSFNFESRVLRKHHLNYSCFELS